MGSDPTEAGAEVTTRAAASGRARRRRLRTSTPAAVDRRNFKRIVDRIADSTGIPLDAPVGALSQELRDELELGRFASAANTPDASALQKAAGRALRPAATAAFRLLGRLRRVRG